MAAHKAEYGGRWVALDGDRLIAAGATEAEVAEAAEKNGAYLPLIGYIPHPDEPTFRTLIGMPETLRFEITYLYEDATEGIAIPVTLICAPKIYNTWGKVDTGAEVCLFSNEAGLRLGLDIERGIPKGARLGWWIQNRILRP